MENVSENISMIVLAGGKSSRMGRDKADLELSGKTFLELQIGKGEQLGIRDILVSGYRGSDCKYPVIPDRFRERGPLGGLEACLRKAGHGRCLVLSVDVPGVPLQELRRLMEKSLETELPVVMQHGEKVEPLIGVYPVRLADAIAEELEKGYGKVYHFLQAVGYEVCHSDTGDEYFENVNRQDDYENILKRYGYGTDTF